MSPEEHIQAAETSIDRADSMDDPMCALAEATLAQAHLQAAAVRMANFLISKGKRPADMLHMGLDFLKLAK